jgi:hypothetical protein
MQAPDNRAPRRISLVAWVILAAVLISVIAWIGFLGWFAEKVV